MNSSPALIAPQGLLRCRVSDKKTLRHSLGHFRYTAVVEMRRTLLGLRYAGTYVQLGYQSACLLELRGVRIESR